jgi:acetyltransferase-like isoleucine patch superfamily enzyme
MKNPEEIIEQWLKSNEKNLSKRMKRFLAMYFPNAKIRRKYWLETSVKLGTNTYLNPGVIVADDYQTGKSLLKIGNNCSIAPGVVFAPISTHNNSKILRKMGILKKYEIRKPIIIANDVWIGANSTILGGIKIGSCSIIGANSFVNKDIPPFSLAYGCPIRIIKDLREK